MNLFRVGLLICSVLACGLANAQSPMIEKSVVGGGIPLLTTVPAIGSTLTFPEHALGAGSSTRANVLFQNPGLAEVPVNCPQPFSPFGLMPVSERFFVPAQGSISIPVLFNGPSIGTYSGQLLCNVSTLSQTITINLSATVGPAAMPLPTLGDGGRLAMLSAMLAVGMLAVGLRKQPI